MVTLGQGTGVNVTMGMSLGDENDKVFITVGSLGIVTPGIVTVTE